MTTMDVVAEQINDIHIVEEEENGDQASVYNETEEPIVAADSILNKSFPLIHEWGFYFLSNEKQIDWMERLSRVCDLTTVEEFWAFVDRIRPPSSMQQCDYSLFKYKIQPVWEEPENKEGGRIVFQLSKQDQMLLNELWLKLMLAMIGNYFGDLTDLICGAVCSSRNKGSKISLWTTNADNDTGNKDICVKLKTLWSECSNQRSGESIQIPLHYECHRDAQNKQSSLVPRKFTM